ncbi:MAG: M1 family metallopeptidase [Acidobacteriota bacterium]
MLRPCAIFLLVLVFVSPGASARQLDGAGRPDPVHYTLDARLDAPNRLLTGRGRLSWRNPSNRPATELRFQMAWNAWRDANSSWMRDRRLAGAMALEGRTDEDAGFIDLTTLVVAGPLGADLLAGARFIAPDDRNGDDRTVLAVPLPAPVAAGATIDVEFAWNAHVPRALDRAGVIDRTYMLASWFPQVGVLQDDGWHCHQIHPDSPAFNEFGRYDVALTVPGTWTIGATGIEGAPSTNGDGTTTHRYSAEGVQDFAWTTSPDYVERTDRIPRVGRPDIRLRLLLQPEHVEQGDRQLAAVRAAIQVYERRVGAFPWPQLTIVDPVSVINPRAQGTGIGAAAYPMMIVGNTRWLTPWTSAVPEAALTNQVGREFFAVNAAPDAVDHPWMDAGIAALALARVMPEAFPQRFVRVDRYFGGLITWPHADVPWRAADEAPGARWLSTLAAHVGDETMTRILSAYYAEAVHRHPNPATFLAVARAATNQNLDWFAEAIARPDVRVDYAVGTVLSSPTETGSVDTTVVVERLAEGVLPVEVRVTFADGSDVMERWDGRDPSHMLRYRRGSSAIAVDIDPDYLLRVERRRTNNSWLAQPAGPLAADRWSLRWMTWVQHTLMSYAFFV